MRRAWVLALVVAVGCKDKPTAAPPPPTPVSAHPTPEPTPIDRPKVVIDGPSITPVIGNAITFVVPKDAPWWAEIAFPCYAGAIQLQAGASPAETFTRLSPLAEPALKAADIDLDHDVGAIGVFGCGEGACAYIALQLRDPDRLGGLLGRFTPGAVPKTIGKNHYAVATPGGRTIHLQAVPISWPATTPNDLWSRQAARATHVVFISGLFGKGTELADATPLVADARPAAGKVSDIEKLVPDSRGRCVIGEVGKRRFQPGYQLDRARFALVAPEGQGDALTKLLGSLRTLDLEIDLGLTPAPTEAVVQTWIQQARAFVSTSIEPVRQQFAAQGAAMDVMFEVGALLGKSGFRHTLSDKGLALSFRTDRISEAELATVEARLEAVMKQTSP